MEYVLYDIICNISYWNGESYKGFLFVILWFYLFYDVLVHNIYTLVIILHMNQFTGYV